MTKLRTFGITHFFDIFILSRTLKLKKKNYQFEKSSEIDFRIRLVESQNHGMKQNFFVENQKPPVAEAIIVTNFLFRN